MSQHTGKVTLAVQTKKKQTGLDPVVKIGCVVRLGRSRIYPILRVAGAVCVSQGKGSLMLYQYQYQQDQSHTESLVNRPIDKLILYPT